MTISSQTKTAIRAALTATAALWLAGCGHHKQQAVYVPPPPAYNYPQQPAYAPPANTGMATPPASPSNNMPQGPAIFTQTGMASWYGPPYNRRRGANGEIFDQDAVTAAHRTLPMGSLIRVTNLATGQTATMRVTDRGPFVPDRVLDLSVGAAKTIGVWRPGTAQVRIDVLEAPKPIDTGGRWCVQIGAFHSSHDAEKLEEHLQKKYQTANVIEFTGPTGHWVRIRPAGDDRNRADQIQRELEPSEGLAYLVRLD